MKQYIFTVLLLAGSALFFTSCDNGAYTANPDKDYSNSINPLNPKGGMDNSMSWSGEAPMSAEINGTPWRADIGLATNYFIDTTYYIMAAYNLSGDTSGFTFTIKKGLELNKDYFISQGSPYGEGFYNPKFSNDDYYYSSNGTRVGAIRLLEQDANHIKGLFYFLAISPQSGEYINVQKGFFDVTIDNE